MLADCLTKQMISAIIYDLLHFGYWQFDNKNIDPLCAPELALRAEFDESELVNIKNTRKADEMSVKQRRPEWESPSCAFIRISLLHM